MQTKCWFRRFFFSNWFHQFSNQDSEAMICVILRKLNRFIWGFFQNLILSSNAAHDEMKKGRERKHFKLRIMLTFLPAHQMSTEPYQAELCSVVHIHLKNNKQQAK